MKPALAHNPMNLQFEQWRSFLAIDDATVSTLNEFAPLIAPHLDEILDALYARIASSEVASGTFTTKESMVRARQQQRRHWLEHVFLGKFDDKYVEDTCAIGKAHHRLGVDLRLYMGAYAVVLNELTRLITGVIPIAEDSRLRYLVAINNAVFLDMGLATYVYYDSVVSDVESMAQELNLSLARAGEYRDNETGKYITRMSKMCQALALAIGKDVDWARMLRIASPLHDVGKIGIPDSVLLKPGRLSSDEYRIMQGHPEIGGTIIPDHSAEVIRMARRISLTHHEKWDGSGYPAGLTAQEIPLEGRIAGLCDVYDALVSKRPYKQPWEPERALQYLRSNSGVHFDPELVEAFFRILPEINLIQADFAEAGESESIGALSAG